jgi:hypothetical protein
VGRKSHLAVEHGRAADCRPPHDDEAGPVKVVHKALGDDRRHELGGVALPLAIVES